MWLSGVQSWDENFTISGAGDAGDQVRVTMRNIEAILAQLGGALSDVVKAAIYVVVTSDDETNLDGAWAAG